MDARQPGRRGPAAPGGPGLGAAPRTALVIGGVMLLALTAARALLFLSYGAFFDELPALHVVRAFVHGLRFDASITVLLLGLPLWLMALPARWARREAVQRTLRWVTFGIVVICVFVIAADLVYFSVGHRHIGAELALTMRDDWQAAAQMPLDYPLPLAAFLVVATGLAFLWRALPSHDPPGAGGRSSGMRKTPTPAWKAWAAWAAFLPLAVIAVRGGLQDKPLNIVNAFRYGSVAEGYLTLNGPFSVVHSTRNTRRGPTLSTVPWDEAIRTVRARFALDGEEWASDAYPLERRPAARPASGTLREGMEPMGSAGAARATNVVVLVLESWDALLTDSIRAREGLPPLGITPNFDALVQEGRLFTRFVASGQLSIEGLAALLASIPTVPGMPYMGTGLEQSRLSFLGELAGRRGYTGIFVRSARRGSFRLDAVAALAGFDRYAGAEDILRHPSHTTAPSGYWGAWDYDSLRYFHERILETDGPFVGFFFGSSTHQPYPSPGQQWARLPPDTRENRFLNAVHYVDWALGRYLEMARDAGYFDDTLFIVLADQTSPFVAAATPPDRHRIPALIVGPGIPRNTVDDRVASHMDVVPTVIDYLGWHARHASFGESLLGRRRPAALMKSGETILRIGPDGWVLHDLTRRLDGGGTAEAQAGLEAALLAEVQVVTRLLGTNRVYSGIR